MNGTKNGKGIEYNKFHTIIYEGGYANGKKSGYGREYNRRGYLMYEGEFLNGKRNGIGKEYNIFGNLIFKGEYLNGKKWNGEGKKFYGEYQKNISFINGEQVESSVFSTCFIT